MRRRLTSVLLALSLAALVVLLAGCGGTKTSTMTKTMTATAPTMTATVPTSGTTVATTQPAPPAIVVLPSAVRPGQQLTVSGSVAPCPVGDQVTLISGAFPHTHDFAGQPALETPVLASGGFRVTTTVPKGTKPGAYTVTGRCGGGNLGVSAQLTVLS